MPRSLAGGCPTPPGHRDVTEKRILVLGRHGKAHSGRGLSRKGAFYDPRTNQTAVFGEALEQNALFGLAAIEGRVQSAPFREVRRSGQAWGQRSVHRSARTASRSRSGAFVYTIATRAASGGTRASTAMARRRRPLAGPLPLGRENRLCASAAAASLASSLMSSLTQTPEEPNDAWLALTIIAVVIGCTVSSFHSPYGSGQRLVLLGYTG